MDKAHYTILLVDNNAFRREQIAHLLEKIPAFDITVYPVNGLDACMVALDQRVVDLILLQPYLDEIKGIPAFLSIHKKASHLPIIVLTPLKEKATGIGAIERGAQDAFAFEKLDEDTLCHAIRGALLRKKREVVLEKHAEALERHKKEYKRFTYVISHDLKAPVRSIKGFSEAIIDDYEAILDEEGKTFLHRILRAAFRMEEMIDDLIAYGKMTSIEIFSEKVDLEGLIGRVVDEIDLQIREKKAHVIIDKSFPAVLANASVLLRILTNLVLNALTFCQEGVPPEITIRSESCNDSVKLWIEDQGIGIDRGDQKRIFNVFERLHSKDDYPGTGIGLSIVKMGIERMGGHVGVVSEKGSGARFWLTLKACE